MCDTGELDACEVFDEQERTARKPHRCDCCQGFIRTGEKYLRHFSVLDGDPTSEKICTRCVADRKDFLDEHTGGQLTGPTNFRRMLQECVVEDVHLAHNRWLPMWTQLKARREATA